MIFALQNYPINIFPDIYATKKFVVFFFYSLIRIQDYEISFQMRILFIQILCLNICLC